MPGLDTCFLEVGAHVSLKVATNDYFRDKETIKISTLGCFSETKTEECDQKN